MWREENWLTSDQTVSWLSQLDHHHVRIGTTGHGVESSRGIAEKEPEETIVQWSRHRATELEILGFQS